MVLQLVIIYRENQFTLICDCTSSIWGLWIDLVIVRSFTYIDTSIYPFEFRCIFSGYEC